MARVGRTTAIDRPADALWHAISDFGAAGQCLVGVVACAVEGAGVGARRTLASGDGGTVLERQAVGQKSTSPAHPSQG